ncbi:GSCOCG00002384001-RA-CDS [Cotesia congregata]|uniref:Selenoprotein F n=1 Tax=Cotesia congregata TaxID=51543 RepID=A0A8J2H799_COTCN|nr:GSCOCG00002384001-RA-CDS [Cotesia congregata]CAG5080822.1 Similar to SELENOF: Selenoprotein F (Bos taurus) [Cotesia congregata]
MYSYIFILILATVNVFSEFTSEDCQSLGFNRANLLCSTCDQFSKYNLSELDNNCQECCLKEEDSSSKRYPRAVLEVCTCKFGAYPQIQAFIKSDRPSKHKNLEIKYVRGLDPMIKLYDHDNKLEDILDITKWDTDDVEEFLQTHLMRD